MLATIQLALKENYYDRSYRGIDLDAHFKAAAAKIDEAQSMVHAYGIIAQTLIAFDDSHTFFVPPARPSIVEYGWQMQMVGEACFITAVKPGSDAEAKGVKAGDQLLQLDQFIPTRNDFWKLRYLLHILSPRRTVNLVVRSPGGEMRQLLVDAKVTPQPKVVQVDIDSLETLILREFSETRKARNRFQRAGTVAVWKMSGFDFNPDDVDKVMTEGLKDATALVLDMRGNGGGFMKTLEQVAGRLFDRDILVGELKTRKSSKPMTVKKKRGAFTGPIVVLVDADTGSAAEILARIVQLEKRGVVLGDRTAGAVMQGELMTDGVPMGQGIMMYHASITNADLVMTDGASLEKAGVVPDEVLTPTAADFAAGRDPVLARAIALVGGSLDAVAAGKLFPFEWK